MPPIEDHQYLRTCGKLATCLSISIASARRQVDLIASRDGIKEVSHRKAIAEKLLDKAQSMQKEGAANLDLLLVALAEEENFMTED